MKAMGGRPSTRALSVLTIAGSDSGGAAGLQADLKTWASLGAYGMSAITAVTAQNSERVAAVHYLPREMVAAQIDTVLSDYGAAAIKTGFLGRVDIIEAAADRLAYWRNALPNRPFVVIDPVLVNHRGEAMFGPEVAASYRELLFPLADLVTPNAAEAALLNVTSGETSGRDPRLLVKGVSRGDQIVDAFWDGREWTELLQPRIDTVISQIFKQVLAAGYRIASREAQDVGSAVLSPILVIQLAQIIVIGE